MKLQQKKLHVLKKKQKQNNMDNRIKEILPENIFGYENYEVLAENVTYIFEVPDEHYHVTYELDNFISDMDINRLYGSKLRECYDNDRVHIASSCNCTGTPRGYVVNVSQADAIKLEKELIIFSLLRDTIWNVTKIDNVQIALDKAKKEEEFFNSLFTVE